MLNEEVRCHGGTKARKFSNWLITIAQWKFSLYGLIKKALRKLDWKALKRKTDAAMFGFIVSW